MPGIRGDTDHRAAQPELGATLDFLDRARHGIGRYHRDAKQAARRGMAKIGEPIVEGAEARGAKVEVRDGIHQKPPRTVQQFGFDSLGIQLFHTVRRVIGALRHVRPAAFLLEVTRVGFSIFSLRRQKADAGLFTQCALTDVIIGIVFDDEPRRTVTISPLDPFEPKIRRLDNVGIG